ncbi:MAG: LPS export ABC transporter ATP-binding protein [Candidatus Stahlbacteria bacterium]|nr:LPS export ABC transporter ATP-binding protein [Candidatus Stahlbacteria bacterium]
MEILRTERLNKSYKKRKVVDNVAVELKKGEIVGLLGPNGAGKTTTFYMIMGFITPDSGKVFLDDKDITHQPMHIRARMGIGYLPQETSIFRKLTVEQNIMAILELVERNRKTRKEMLEGILKMLSIERVRKQLGIRLSGGERRRVEIGRALAISPSFLLLDEPFTGVDPLVREDIQNIVQGLKQQGIGVLITDHNVRETLEITDRAYIMYEGKILLAGKTMEIVQDPKARELYLGEKFRL